MEQLKAYTNVDGPEVNAPDEVSKATIRHWCEAMQDGNPLYTDEGYARTSKYGSIVAPPTMLMAWSFPPLWPPIESHEGPLDNVLVLLDAAGFNQVIITGTSQRYLKPLFPGDRVSFNYRVENVSPERQTALGNGHFVTAVFVYRNQKGEEVGNQTLTILKYRTAA